MRNLLQYPITKDEVLKFIDFEIKKQEDIPPEDYPVGSMVWLYLLAVRKSINKFGLLEDEYTKNKTP